MQKKEIQNFHNETKLFEEMPDYETQIETYKQILIKQKEIMIAMTESLKEKEETMTQMQKEIEVFDKIHQDTKEALNKENLRVQFLEKLLKKNGIEYDQNPKLFRAETVDLELTHSSPANQEKQNQRNSQLTIAHIIEIKSIY